MNWEEAAAANPATSGSNVSSQLIFERHHMATLTEQRVLDDKLRACVRRAAKIVEQAELPTYNNYQQDVIVRAFDRTLQRIHREEFGR